MTTCNIRGVFCEDLFSHASLGSVYPKPHPCTEDLKMKPQSEKMSPGINQKNPSDDRQFPEKIYGCRLLLNRKDLDQPSIVLRPRVFDKFQMVEQLSRRCPALFSVSTLTPEKCARVHHPIPNASKQADSLPSILD